MKRIFFAVAVLWAMMTACTKDRVPGEIPITLDAEVVTAASANLMARARAEDIGVPGVVLGFQYSMSSDMSGAQMIDAVIYGDGGYWVPIYALETKTTYYFRTFVRRDGEEKYGKTKSFTTKGIETLIKTGEVSNIRENDVDVSGELYLDAVRYTSVSFAFCCGKTESADDRQFTAVLTDNTIRSSFYDLTPNTRYWYKTFVNLNGRDYFGETKSFTTAGE